MIAALREPPERHDLTPRRPRRCRAAAVSALAAALILTPAAAALGATPTAVKSTTAAGTASSTSLDTAGRPDGFGTALAIGGAPSSPTDPVVGIAALPAGGGYWIASADGAVFSFGTAYFHGSMGGKHLVRPIVGIASTPDGQGYWLVAADGGVFSFGDAHFHGSTGAMHLNRPIVGIASSADGRGYWLVAADGGVFSFGNAIYHGSAVPYRPLGRVVGIAAGPRGGGYWLASSDGGVYSFGDAHFHGAASGALANPIVAVSAPASGTGYWLLPTSPPPPLPPPPPPLPPPGFVPGKVTAIGDSVMLDAEPDLQADIPGIDVEAAVSRQWDAGVALIQSLRSERALGATVVIDLGTNGPVSDGQFQQMMAALAGASRVVFVTVHLPPSYSWWQSVNATLESEVPLYPDARIADFNSLADQHPEWFGPDGVHMPIGGAGAQAMASLVAGAI